MQHGDSRRRLRWKAAAQKLGRQEEDGGGDEKASAIRSPPPKCTLSFASIKSSEHNIGRSPEGIRKLVDGAEKQHRIGVFVAIHPSRKMDAAWQH